MCPSAPSSTTSKKSGLSERKTRKNYILAEIPTRYGWDGALTEKRYE